MLPEDQKRILGYFIEEAKDHLNTIEQGLLNLQATIEDSEMINELFRAAHSVKGGAAMLGLESIQKTSHRMEDYFKVLKESPVQADRNLESLLLRIFDGLQEQLEQLQGPFGLTDDKAQEILAGIDPIFGEVEQHLEQLAKAVPVSSQPPAPTARAEVATAAVSHASASTTDTHSEASALQLVFKSDVPALLRDMLGLFKQADTAKTRSELQAICQKLVRIGEQFELANWCKITNAARQVVSNEQQTYRALAPVVIKELKQAQDLVLAGQGSQIQISEAFQELLPHTSGITDDLLTDDSLDALLDEALSTETEEPGLADLFETAEADLATDALELPPIADWLNDVPASPSDGEDNTETDLASVFDSFEIETVSPSESQSITAENAPTGRVGPEVGTAELNSLADLFEGEISDLDEVWEEEAVEVEALSLTENLNPTEIPSEFADLLLSDEDTLEESESASLETDFDSLFGNAPSNAEVVTEGEVTEDIVTEENNQVESLSSEDFDFLEETDFDLEEETAVDGEAQAQATDTADAFESEESQDEIDSFFTAPGSGDFSGSSADSSPASVDAFFDDLGSESLSTDASSLAPVSALEAEDSDASDATGPADEEMVMPDSEAIFNRQTLTETDSGDIPLPAVPPALASEDSGNGQGESDWGLDSLALDSPDSHDHELTAAFELDDEFLGEIADTSEDSLAADSWEATLGVTDEIPETYGEDSTNEDQGISLPEQTPNPFSLEALALDETPAESTDAGDLDALFGLEEEQDDDASFNLDTDDLAADTSEAEPLNLEFLDGDFEFDELELETSTSTVDMEFADIEDDAQLTSETESDLDLDLDATVDLSADDYSLDEVWQDQNPDTVEPRELATDAENWDDIFSSGNEADGSSFSGGDELFGDVISLPSTRDSVEAGESSDLGISENSSSVPFSGATGQDTSDIPETESEAPSSTVAAASAVDNTEDLDGEEGFSDLESLLDDDSTAPAENQALSASQMDPVGSEDFDDLETLLEDQPDANDTGDGFADLEALLEDEEGMDISGRSTNFDLDVAEDADEDSEDEFEDLEKLLEEADQLGGGVPTVGSRRQVPRTTRRGSGLVDQTMRVSVKHLDNLNNLVGELVVNRNSLEQDQERLRQFLDNLLFQVQQLNDVGQRMRDLYERSLLESSLMSSRQTIQAATRGGGAIDHSHATGAQFDALEMDRFTGFHTLSQEMIELIVRVRESASDIGFTIESSDQITRQFRQVTTQLQEGLNKARMVPFAQTADRLPRAVRDISLKCGKEAKLVVEGRDTLIDKMILERLYDPMTHLVNNAITHGIESPEERLAAGKSREGTITVRAFYQGNQTVIYIADDGAGIDADMVKQKALERKIITPEEAEDMSQLEVYELLFIPGFSTRDRADDFAGRGVGMDVVQTALAEIRGAIIPDSELGRGTSFTIRLPLTLSISKALSCVNNQARIAFPMDGVEDMFDIPRDRIQTNDQGQSCILWRDTLLPFRPLGDLLQFNRSLGRGRVYGGNQDEDMVSVVVLRSANTFIALQVDQVIGEQEIVIKQLEGPVPKPMGIAGATVLGDGRVMPIADVLELIDLSMGRVRREQSPLLWQTDDSVPAEESPAAKSESTVLIVDDSITVRELLSMSFNKVGYRVEQARDGQEAWEKLRSGLPCDLVFCDIEMPRMDGLELLSRMQKDTSLSQIPIAMLTSRGADRHRQMAVDLGASGYFTKPYLEEALLDAAKRMLGGERLVGGHE